ncbi:hypothetical protein M9H77_02963 [Catharanthus roseus]|uniref:Uncharacterized protein n=1 Tax=Catharanthus roseus TaxID=4058 RepID=A0ACC0CA35_CATRO|nr:hypothetical protein M9H77_02963 [Catharanthus roseus]
MSQYFGPFSLCFFIMSSFHLATADSNYENFAHCLANYSISNDQISQILYSPGHPSFTPILNAYVRNRRFNTSSTPKPIIIVTPLVVNHVQATILCSKSLGLQVKIRSGGHDYEGVSYVSEVPFVVLDMFNLRSINVDIEKETAWVQSEQNPCLPCWSLHNGGHISGGGYGAMLRKYGLTVDNLLDAQIVDVQDLFWAISGGGGASFGVVLAYKVKLVRVPEIVTVFRVEKRMEQNAIEIVYGWQEVASKMDNDLFSRLMLQPVKGKVTDQKTVRASFIALSLGDSNRLMSVMNDQFPELGLKREDCLEMGWAESVLQWSNFPNGTALEVLLNRIPNSVTFLKRKSDYVMTPIPKDGLESIFKKLIQLRKTGLVINPYGGRMCEIPENETPFPHRAGLIYKIQYSVNWEDADLAVNEKYIEETRELFDFMTPFLSKNPRQAFLNYRDLDIGTTSNGYNSYNEGKVFGFKYFKGNFDRLVKVKTMIDPDNFFRNEQSIPTLSVGVGGWSSRKSL